MNCEKQTKISSHLHKRCNNGWRVIARQVKFIGNRLFYIVNIVHNPIIVKQGTYREFDSIQIDSHNNNCAQKKQQQQRHIYVHYKNNKNKQHTHKNSFIYIRS